MSWRWCHGAAHQLAGALALMFVVGGVAHVAGWRSPLLTALRCCKLALLFVVGGALVLVSVALLMQLAGALMVVLPMEHAHVAGWCS